MKFASILGLVAAFLGFTIGHAEEPDKGKDASGSLIGVYTITAGERDGKELPAVELKDVTMQIAANAISTFDKDKKQIYVATYTLDPTKKPWRITMTATLTPEKGGEGTKAEGLISKEGDTVRLIYALPKGSTPTEFKTDRGQQMFTLKAQKK
jgi:uncharacterized protein (TIGR03067 family)